MEEVFPKYPFTKIEVDTFGLIQKNVPFLEQALVMLRHSLERCNSIENKKEYSLDLYPGQDQI